MQFTEKPVEKALPGWLKCLLLGVDSSMMRFQPKDDKVHKHILIADDEKNTLLCLSIILKAEGHKVSLAENGEMALHKLVEAGLQKNTPDLLITDVHMPVLDGIGLIDAVRKKGMDIPIVVISGFRSRDIREKLKIRKPCFHLEKPFGKEEILSVVAKAFEKD